jgi:uncharacterized delta-60 repeat protein
MKQVYFFFILFTLASSGVLAQYQMLDSTFNTDGIVTTDICPQSDYIGGIAIQSDQKIVAAGNANNQFTVARYMPDGSLDVSFGTGGFVITPLGAFSSAGPVVIQPDGKIVAGGIGFVANADFAVVRYHSNGTLDSTFAGDGIAYVAIGSEHDFASTMLLQPDGKIVLGGRVVAGSLTHFALARLDSSGGPDLSFGTGGSLTTAFGTTASDIRSIALQTDGKIVATGYVASTGPSGNDFALARYEANGTLDASFGTGGKTITDISGDGEISKKVLILADGRILVAGEVDEDTLEENFALMRYTASGILDNTFDTDGVVTTDFYGDNDNPASMVMQPDGKIIIAGYVYHLTSLINFGLARYNPDGSLDNTFGTGGILWTYLGPGNHTITDVALQADGKIVAGGGLNTGTPTSEFALARYVPDNATGIAGISSSAGFINVYPNPFSGQLTLRLANNMQATIILYDIFSRQILQETFANSATIYTDQLADGIYFYELKNKSGTIATGKIIKQ